MKRKFYGALIYPAFMALMLPGPSFAQTLHAPAAHPVLSLRSDD